MDTLGTALDTVEREGRAGGRGERVLGEGFSLHKDPTAEAAYFSSKESVASYFCIMRFASADSMQLPVQKRERKNDIELEVEIMI